MPNSSCWLSALRWGQSCWRRPGYQEREATPLVDAFFTAVSAATVTGLAVVDTLDHWNWWGQLVVLALVQTGGLGFTVGASILLQMLRRGIGAYSLRDELLLKDGAPALSLQEAVTSPADHPIYGRCGNRRRRAASIWYCTVADMRPADATGTGYSTP